MRHHSLIGPYHVKKEEKQILDKDRKTLIHLGILEEGFSAYSSKKVNKG